MNTVGGFKCKCPPHWTGPLCNQGSCLYRKNSSTLSELMENEALSGIILRETFY